MVNFYKRALKKFDKLDCEQCRDLLVSAVGQISLLETVMNSVDAGVLVCSKNNNLVFVNKSAPRLLPLDYSEGVLMWTAIRDEKIARFFKNILLNGERLINHDMDIVQQDRHKLLSVSVMPLVQDSRVIGSVIYLEDITEKRKEEARIRRVENLASLTTLAGGVAHEIKNPLGSISIHLQLLQKALKKNKSDDKSTDKFFNVLKEEVDRLNRIVVEFLFAVRPMSLELREGDINALLLKLREFVGYEMEQSKIHCRLELDENLPKVLMDERYMKQALLNLATNAKAAMPGGGELLITSGCVDNEIKISISDTGAGIKEENIPRIFEPYFTTKDTGTGLGLTQVFKIIKEHQGEIYVNSKYGKGASFEVILPAVQKKTRLIPYNETIINGD